MQEDSTKQQQRQQWLQESEQWRNAACSPLAKHLLEHVNPSENKPSNYGCLPRLDSVNVNGYE